MAVSLTKGAKVSLTKEAGAAGLQQIVVGLGWDKRQTAGADFDCDAAAFMLTDAGKVRNDKDFVFYGNPESPEGAVKHAGDNRSGEGAGDDETIVIDLTKVPAGVKKVAITATIHDADTRRQNFGMITNAYIRVVNKADNTELARFDLSEDHSTVSALIFGEVYLHNNEWKFGAVGQGFTGGLAELCSKHGIDVE